MNAFATLIDRFNLLVPAAVDTGFGAPPTAEEALIGFFQSFRPDGERLESLYEGMAGENDLADRLEKVFEVAGDARRPQGGMDAYFVVRAPQQMDPEVAKFAGETWLGGMAELARCADRDDLLKHLDPIPEIRVLEGIAPKNPKFDSDKTELFRVLNEELPQVTAALADHQDANILRPAYYFIACDPMLRDHLMWPLYRQEDNSLPADPFSAYFDLWRHRVRFRTYRDGHMDLYLPRHDD